MAGQNFDATKLEAFQKLLQSDPKALEKLLGQVSPEQLGAALSIFKNLDPKTQATLGNVVTGLLTNGSKGEEKSSK